MRLNIFYILLIALCGLYGCKNHQQPIIKENLNILPTIYPEYQGALLLYIRRKVHQSEPL